MDTKYENLLEGRLQQLLLTLRVQRCLWRLLLNLQVQGGSVFLTNDKDTYHHVQKILFGRILLVSFLSDLFSIGSEILNIHMHKLVVLTYRIYYRTFYIDHFLLILQASFPTVTVCNQNRVHCDNLRIVIEQCNAGELNCASDKISILDEFYISCDTLQIVEPGK